MTGRLLVAFSSYLCRQAFYRKVHRFAEPQQFEAHLPLAELAHCELQSPA